MNKLLLVIDVQKDFVNENTKEYVNKIEELIDSKKYNHTVFTQFINSKDSKWYNELKYNGCMDEQGQKLLIDTKDNYVISKTIYSSLSSQLIKYIKDNNIEQIYLCGFDTDACVQKTAMDLFENDYDVFVLENYCMSSYSRQIHEVTINNLKRLIGKDRII